MNAKQVNLANKQQQQAQSSIFPRLGNRLLGELLGSPSDKLAGLAAPRVSPDWSTSSGVSIASTAKIIDIQRRQPARRATNEPTQAKVTAPNQSEEADRRPESCQQQAQQVKQQQEQRWLSTSGNSRPPTGPSRDAEFQHRQQHLEPTRPNSGRLWQQDELSSFESDYDLLVYLGETETEDIVDTERSLDYQDQTWRQSICGGASLAPTIDDNLSDIAASPTLTRHQDHNELVDGPASNRRNSFDLLNSPAGDQLQRPAKQHKQHQQQQQQKQQQQPEWTGGKKRHVATRGSQENEETTAAAKGDRHWPLEKQQVNPAELAEELQLSKPRQDTFDTNPKHNTNNTNYNTNSNESKSLPRKGPTMATASNRRPNDTAELDRLLAEMSQTLDLDSLARFDPGEKHDTSASNINTNTKTNNNNKDRPNKNESESRSRANVGRHKTDEQTKREQGSDKATGASQSKQGKSMVASAKQPVASQQPVDSILNEYDDASRMLEHMISDQLGQAPANQIGAPTNKQNKRHQQQHQQDQKTQKADNKSESSRRASKTSVIYKGPANKEAPPNEIDQRQQVAPSPAYDNEHLVWHSPINTRQPLFWHNHTPSAAIDAASHGDLRKSELQVQPALVAGPKRSSDQHQHQHQHQHRPPSQWGWRDRLKRNESSDDKPPRPPEIDYPRAEDDGDVIEVQPARYPASPSSPVSGSSDAEHQSQMGRMKRHTLSRMRSMRSKFNEFVEDLQSSKRSQQQLGRDRDTDNQDREARQSRSWKRSTAAAGHQLSSLGQQIRQRLSRSKSRIGRLITVGQEKVLRNKKRSQSQPNKKTEANGDEDQDQTDEDKIRATPQRPASKASAALRSSSTESTVSGLDLGPRGARKRSIRREQSLHREVSPTVTGKAPLDRASSLASLKRFAMNLKPSSIPSASTSVKSRKEPEDLDSMKVSVREASSSPKGSEKQRKRRSIRRYKQRAKLTSRNGLSSSSLSSLSESEQASSPTGSPAPSGAARRHRKVSSSKSARRDSSSLSLNEFGSVSWAASGRDELARLRKLKSQSMRSINRGGGGGQLAGKNKRSPLDTTNTFRPSSAAPSSTTGTGKTTAPVSCEPLADTCKSQSPPPVQAPKRPPRLRKHPAQSDRVNTSATSNQNKSPQWTPIIKRDGIKRSSSIKGQSNDRRWLRNAIYKPTMTTIGDLISLSSSSTSSSTETQQSLDSQQQQQQSQSHQKEQLYHIVNEIHSTEAKFVDTLRLLNVDFRQHMYVDASCVPTASNKLSASSSCSSLGKSPSLLSLTSAHSSSNLTNNCPLVSNGHGKPYPADAVCNLLKYLPQLQALNENLLAELDVARRQYPKEQKIAHVLIKVGPFLKHYSSYIREFESMQKHYLELMRKYPTFREKVNEFENEDKSKKLSVLHHLLKPIQRIPQYRLLLQQYLHHLRPGDPDFDNTVTALQVVSEVAEHANQSMNEGANFSKLLSLQTKILNRQRGLVKPGRMFVMEGSLMKICRKQIQPRWFVLLSDALLYMINTRLANQKYNFFPQTSDFYYMKAELSLDQCHVSAETGNETEFSVYTRTKSFTLIAKDAEERNEWLAALSKTIEQHQERQRSFTIHTQTQGSDGGGGATSSQQQQQQLLIPHKPHDQQQHHHHQVKLGEKAPVWVPDSKVSRCPICAGHFTALFRRHHCRACGQVVCADCSNKKAPLLYKRRHARVCLRCYAIINKDYPGAN